LPLQGIVFFGWLDKTLSPTQPSFKTGKKLEYYQACDKEDNAEGKDVPNAGQCYHSSS